jgi:site-specific DNA recombinase
LIAKLDRLTRSLRDWQQLLDEFFGERAGRSSRSLFSVADSLNTKTAMGRLSLNMSMAFSEFERDIIGERTKDALRYKIGKGERVGAIRFGYKLAKDGRTLEPDPAEQRAIALMVELRGQGMTLRSIALELGLAGFRTKEGGPWSPKVVSSILSRASAA